jgi:mRNA-degrading endonuclease RelE of RelBE toxin-antitoxin system
VNDLLVIETESFAAWVRKGRLRSAVDKLIDDLKENPTEGVVIRSGKSFRKVRMAGLGRGKSGGFRVIYVLLVSHRVAALVDGYSKAEKEDLSADELKALVALLPQLEAMAALAVAEHDQQAEGE